MTEDIEFTFKILSVAFGCAAWTIGVIKYLVDRMDKMKEDLHSRISDRVHKEDFDKHIARTENEFKSFREEFRSVQLTITQRLDSIMLAIGKVKTND